jgi:hypothetical protein
MNLESIEFVSETGYHVTIGAYCSPSGKPCHWLEWSDDDEPRREMFEYESIVDCFAKKIWRIKHVGKPVKMFPKFGF